MSRFHVLLLMIFMGIMPILAGTGDVMVAVGDTTIMPLNEIIAKGLPVMFVETVNEEEPTCDYVSAPPGCMGASITNATKVPGRLVIYQLMNGLDQVLYDSGDYEKNVGGMTIKLRGNTSAYQDKKPYKIKLQRKADLLLRGNDSIYKDKDWLLLKDDYLTTTVGLKVNEIVGMVWTPQHHFVNVVINGRYRGIYLLCESIKRNPDCRLDVDKSAGYIFEFDPYWWNEDLYVQSSYAPSYNYTFKYPDSEDVLPEQLGYMQSLVSCYEQSVKNGTYSDVIDVASFARWCLVHDIMGTKDAGGANLYYSKYDTTASTPIVMPVAWDFDMALRTTSAWSNSHLDHMMQLIDSPNRAFVTEFAKVWHEIGTTLRRKMNDYMNDFCDSSQGRAMQSSLEINKIVYGHGPSSVSEMVKEFSGWFNSRYFWLKSHILPMNPLGDVNVSGDVDVADVTALIAMVLGGANRDSAPWAADVNDDGLLNIADVTALIQMVLDS